MQLLLRACDSTAAGDGSRPDGGGLVTAASYSGGLVFHRLPVVAGGSDGERGESGLGPSGATGLSYPQMQLEDRTRNDSLINESEVALL